MFISAIQELSFHRKTGVALKWRTRFLLCVEQCSKDSILLMCVECIPALYPYGNSWVVGKALWHIKTRHHQDFHLDDAWFMFSNPVRQMPYISNFRGLLFYDHPSNGRRIRSPLQESIYFSSSVQSRVSRSLLHFSYLSSLLLSEYAWLLVASCTAR